MITNVLRLFYDFLSLKKNGNVPSKRKNKFKKQFVGILKATVLTNRVGSVPKCHGAKTLLVAVTSLKTGTV